MIITIDGTVGTGKSTVARNLAKSIGFIFFDTGAMYRTLTYGILKHSIDINNPAQLQEFLDHFHFDIKVKQHEKRYFYEEEDITEQIRKLDVTFNVSEVAANRAVRDKLTAIQRELAVGVNAVFEGRDMGSVVFPDATVKVFLTAKPEVRAERRFKEIKANNPVEAKNLTIEMCLDAINKRDLKDSTREYAPLCQPKDAFVLDTSELTIDEVVYKILEYKDSLKSRISESDHK
jgi:CMP/dCMP kinase